jgi:hypothetical protein
MGGFRSEARNLWNELGASSARSLKKWAMSTEVMLNEHRSKH